MPDAVAKLFRPHPERQAAPQEETPPPFFLPDSPLGKRAKAREAAAKAREKAKTQEEAKAQEKAKQDSPELAQAKLVARRAIWPQYAEFMGWDENRPEDKKEADRRRDLWLRAWDDFGRWRVGWRKELKSRGEKLGPIFVTDKAAGTITVKKESLLQQFADFLLWQAGQREAERQRKKAEAQRKAMTKEYERVKNGGDRDYGDD